VPQVIPKKTRRIRDASAALRMARMNRLYNDLLEAVPDAMVVVNHAGEIIMLNLQAEKTFCYSRDELIGQKVTRIIPEGFAERLIADALRSTEDALAQQMGTGIERIRTSNHTCSLDLGRDGLVG
jgi:PAS domain S-box-containing protein